MSDDPIAYERDGKVYYRASALGGCLVALAAARQGAEAKAPGEKMMGVFEAGHECEDKFLNEVMPSAFTNRQLRVELPVTKKIVVVGHIDGEHGARIGEVKSQSDEEFRGWVETHWTHHPLWIKYAWQASTYMLATGKELALFRVKRSNPEDFEVWVVKEPFFTLEQIRERVLEAESLAAEDTLTCLTLSFPCPYFYLHAEPDLEVVTDKRLDEAAQDYLRASEDAKFAQAIRAEARKVFDEFLPGDEVTEKKSILTASGIKITRSTYEKKEVVIPAHVETRINVTGGTEGRGGVK